MSVLTGDLLRAVSRSFYLSIVWLPPAMRHSVAVAYLLARATDSVADSGQAPLARRAEALQGMRQALAAPAALPQEPELLERLRTDFAPEKAAEAELLARFGEVLHALRALPAAQADIVRRCLDTIVQGQLWDLTFFADRDAVGSDADTHTYTYRVAGCVGEFWTRIGLCTLGTRFSRAGEEELCAIGVRYGCALQIVNILRDREEDARRGRCYLCSPPQEWLELAEGYLREALSAYCPRLGMWRLRFATMLPAMLGLKTLAALRVAAPGVRVKIPRRAVYACMLLAAAKSVWGH